MLMRANLLGYPWVCATFDPSQKIIPYIFPRIQVVILGKSEDGSRMTVCIRLVDNPGYPRVYITPDDGQHRSPLSCHACDP